MLLDGMDGGFFQKIPSKDSLIDSLLNFTDFICVGELF